MIITSKLTMNLMQPGHIPAVYAVQDDRYSRNLELALYADEETWEIPQNAQVLIRYSKPDGTGGEYDTLPDGTLCWSASGNVLTLALAPQVLTVAGPVYVSVRILLEQAQISTFGILVNVQQAVGREVGGSEDYVNQAGFLPGVLGSREGQYFRILRVDEKGRVTELEAVDLENSVPMVLHVPQSLTQEQQLQARENLNAVSGEEAQHFLERIPAKKNLLADTLWTTGFIYTGGNVSPVSEAIYGTMYSGQFPVTAGEVLTLEYTAPVEMAAYQWRSYNEYASDGSWIRRVAGTVTGTAEGDKVVFREEYTVPAGVGLLRMCARGIFTWDAAPPATAVTTDAYSGTLKLYSQTAGSFSRLLPAIDEADDGKVLTALGGSWMAQEAQQWDRYGNSHIRAVNHRGYCTATPENTLSAFRLSRKMGFDYVECDVRFTSDGHAVLLHDETVDRTSNGTGKIGDMTLAQARALDFGSWFSADYAGEQIPVFSEFIMLCKRIGLKVYAEIKGSIEAGQAQALVDCVKRYGMQNQVSWIASQAASLLLIRELLPEARLGYVSGTAAESTVQTVENLKNGENQVFLNMEFSALDPDLAALCAQRGIDLEAWTVNEESDLAELDPYVSGYSSDHLRANVVLMERFG